MRTKANDLSQFEFNMVSAGHCQVKYTTKSRKDYWIATIDYMPIIDKTKNAEWVKSADIDYLRTLVKRLGTHYSHKGTPIYKYI